MPLPEALFRRGGEALELPRGQADGTFEDAPEVAIVAEPDLGGDRRDGSVGGSEQHSCSGYAKPMDMFGGCLVEGVPKGTPKVEGIKRKRSGNRGGTKVWFVQVDADECCCSSYSLGRRHLSGGRWLEQDL